MLLICRVLYDCAAADNYVTVIHNNGLAFGDSALRIVENELQSICVRLGNSCPLLLLMVTDACFHTARFGDSVAVDKVDVLGCNVFVNSPSFVVRITALFLVSISLTYIGCGSAKPRPLRWPTV